MLVVVVAPPAEKQESALGVGDAGFLVSKLEGAATAAAVASEDGDGENWGEGDEASSEVDLDGAGDAWNGDEALAAESGELAEEDEEGGKEDELAALQEEEEEEGEEEEGEGEEELAAEEEEGEEMAEEVDEEVAAAEAAEAERLQATVGPALPEDEFDARRRQSLRRLEIAMEAIIEKYSFEFEDSDVVDLETGEIVENHGQLENGPIGFFGSTNPSSASRRRKRQSTSPLADGLVRGFLLDVMDEGERQQEEPTLESFLTPRKRDKDDTEPRLSGKKQQQQQQSGRGEEMWREEAAEPEPDAPEQEPEPSYLCEGPGACTKPFCFSCAASALDEEGGADDT